MLGQSQSHREVSICFVALYSFPAIVDDPTRGRIGGAEVQQILIGRNLAQRGYRVSFITLDHGQEREIEIDGMRIIKAYAPNAGIRVLRFLHPRLTHLWRAMKRADADIYYQRTGGSTTGLVAAFCRQQRKVFVFAAAHDYDCMSDVPYLPQRHARVLYRYGLKRANLVVAQTRTQQRLLRESFGVDSVVVPNCAPDHGPSGNDADAAVPLKDRSLLWVGAFVPVKRPERLLDVAEQLQDLSFDVVGVGDAQSEYVRRLLSRAQSLPNVRVQGRVPHEQVNQYYRKATALICTSEAEGFPNVFLEAWSHGLPVVSTFDPDHVIAEQGIGIAARDTRDLVSGIRALLGDPHRWHRASAAARRYYLENHAVDTVIGQLDQALRNVAHAAM